MPDFRARVHAGQTFLVAGERFAIGSSREMSPAGLKAWPRRWGSSWWWCAAPTWATSSGANAFNLGLHVVQSPEAVADAQDGDAFEFDPTRARCAT